MSSCILKSRVYQFCKAINIALITTRLFKIIIILLFTTLPQVNAQKNAFYFEAITSDNGLNTNQVNYIYEDQKGFIWFGTQDGLSRYAGYQVETYKNDPDNENSIVGNIITSIIEEKETENLWIATENGLSYFDRSVNKFERYLNNNNDTITSFCYDENNNLWVGATSGLYRLNADKTFTAYKHDANNNNSIQSSRVFSILKGEGNTIYIGTNIGLDLFDINKNSFTHHTKTPDLKNIRTLYKTSNNDLWIGTNSNGVFRMHENEFKKQMEAFNKENGFLVTNRVQGIIEGWDNDLYIANRDGGLIYFNEEKGIHDTYTTDLYNPNSLNTTGLTTIAKSSTGIVWIGTFNGGVNYIDTKRKNFEHYRFNFREDGLYNNNVRAMFQDSQENIWICTKGKGSISKFNHKKGTFKTYKKDTESPHGLKADYLFSVEEIDAKHLIIATYRNGLAIFNKETEEFTHLYTDENNPNSISSNCVYALHKDNKGTIWVATYGRNGLSGYLNIFNPIDNSFTAIKDIEQVRVFCDGEEDELWMGLFNMGLVLYNTKTKEITQFEHDIDDPSSIAHNNIIALKKDKNGSLWIGTDGGGLSKMNPKTHKCITYTTEDGLPSNRITGMEIDDSGNIWTSTTSGISKFNPDSLTFRNYDAYDGLQGNEFERYVSLKTKSGDIFFGGRNGFNVFHPSLIKDNTEPPKVLITNFKLFNEEVEIGADNSPLKTHISRTKSIKLNHKQSVFTFGFLALNFTSSEKNQYAYILEDFEDEWNYVGTRREATYTNLPAGKYTFRVKAANNDGYWNEEGTSIELIIRPPWWKTIAFYIFLAVFMAAAIYFLIKAREKQLKQDRERLLTELDEGKHEIEEQREKVEHHEEELRKKAEEEKSIKWYNRGFIQLTNIISEKRHDLSELAHSIIFDMVEYLEVQMGAIYFANDNALELMGGYALDDKRLENTTIQFGEGLVGTCFKKKETMKVSDLPGDYADLGSGLGNSHLTNLLLIPIMYEENIEGVIEIISFEEIEDYKTKLLESVGKNLGTALINEKANQKIQEMLKDADEQKETLSSHEEELRQNIEELAATQEESSKREERLLKEIEELKKKLTEKN